MYTPSHTFFFQVVVLYYSFVFVDDVSSWPSGLVTQSASGMEIREIQKEDSKKKMGLLTQYQRKMLKEHEYKAVGCSITEALVLKHFWNWLTALFPRWLAPNTITLVGLIVTLFATSSMILQDLNCQGKVSFSERRF